MRNFIRRQIVRVTSRTWNRIAASVLCRAYERRQISSEQLHTLAKEFDPTQDGEVQRIMRNVRVHGWRP